ncbi:MAG: sulfite exporter TauE/SafE family protein [Bacteroidaceae bacterium]|nr:sulfite exporter TauE/SafE family protein [Bacteroidaceae bacterium]
MMETLNLFQWIVISLTALSIGMSKTGVQGIMLLVVPYMAMAFGAKESTGIILPMLCMADIIAVAYYKRIADWKLVARLLPTAILGFFVAIFVDSLIPTGEFRLLMAWTLALALAVMIWSEIYGKENRWMNRLWYSAIFGLLGGFTTMIGNAAGPVMSVYLLSMRKEKMEYIGINAWFFLVVNLLKVPLQIFVWNNISWHTFTLNLTMIPVIGIGAVLGIWLIKQFPEKAFRRFIQIVTIISVILMFF